MSPRPIPAGLLLGALALLALAYLHGCGGGDGDRPPDSPATSAMTQLTRGLTRSLTKLGMVETGTVLVMNAGSDLSPNATATPDTSAGAPPNTFIYGGTYDGNADGSDETTVGLHVTFYEDPSDLFNGFSGGQGGGTVDIDILSLMHVYHGDLVFSLGMSEHTVSGSGTFADPVSRTTTTMTVSPSAPLKVRPADGTADRRPNACAHSLDGTMQLRVAGSQGTLASEWRFARESTSVAVTGASFTKPSGESTAIPDTSLELGCAGSGNGINDWAGHFRIRWACLPRETGEFTTTITVKNSTTVSMVDDDDTSIDSYDAALIGTSPRAIRGYFIDGPVGARYREDFNWTLNIDGNGFSQTSRYVYIEGTQQGLGGMCVARATRIP
jgi:hypothetical protein